MDSQIEKDRNIVKTVNETMNASQIVQNTDETQVGIPASASIPYPDIMKNYNKGHLFCFMIVPLLAGIAVGYAPSYTNNASKILAAKYNWDSKETKSLNESIVGSSVVLGICFGAAVGGKLI
jgi:hypothetical protein